MGLLHGVGIKDVDYNVYKTGSVDGKRKVLWHCPFYKTWSRMLERCQSEKLHVKYPTYRGCSFISNWVYLSNLKAWMETQDWEGKQLDKDLLVPGNKLYSPETCVFVDQRVNTFITESTSARGKFMIGVSYEKSSNRFVAQCWSVVERKKEYSYRKIQDRARSTSSYPVRSRLIDGGKNPSIYYLVITVTVFQSVG